MIRLLVFLNFYIGCGEIDTGRLIVWYFVINSFKSKYNLVNCGRFFGFLDKYFFIIFFSLIGICFVNGSWIL